MAIFKCKMCGGALEINNNETVATCEYCGTQQTLPKLDDDRRANLYDRANHFHRASGGGGEPLRLHGRECKDHGRRDKGGESKKCAA